MINELMFNLTLQWKYTEISSFKHNLP